MRSSKFTEEQIPFALKQIEMRVSVAECCRKLGIREQTFYRWWSYREFVDGAVLVSCRKTTMDLLLRQGARVDNKALLTPVLWCAMLTVNPAPNWVSMTFSPFPAQNIMIVIT